MRILSSRADEGTSSKQYEYPQSQMVTFVEDVLSLFSVLYIHHGTGTSTRRKTHYLRIDYLDEWSEKKDIFFIELGRDIRKIIKFWEKESAKRLS